MLITHFILATVLLPLAYSCDQEACQIGTSVGAGVCGAVVGVGGAAATATTCLATSWFTFGASCAVAGIAYATVGAACAAGGVVGRAACTACRSDDAPDGSKDATDFDNLANTLDGIEFNQTKNHLEAKSWYQNLNENDRNIILNQGKMITLQQVAIGSLDQIIETTENLEILVEKGHFISLYGQDITRIHNVKNKFKLLTRGKSGCIINDHRALDFLDASLDTVHGLESSFNNVFLMLIGGLIIKPESIYDKFGNEFCKEEVHKYFLDLEMEALIMYTTARAMKGQDVSKSLMKKFNENIVKATSAYVQHCGCPNGLISSNRGEVSSLLDQLPESSQSLFFNIFKSVKIQNENTRTKVTQILELKNIDVNEDTIKVLEKQSWEDIQILRKFTKNNKQGDLEFHDFAKICRSPVKNGETCEKNLCSSTEGCSLTKNNTLTTLAQLNREFFISFEFRATAWQRGWQNVIHFTEGGDCCNVGDRVPGFWVSNSGQLYPCFAVGDNGDYCNLTTKEYSLNTWHKVEFSQSLENAKYMYRVVVDGEDVIAPVENKKPRTFNHIKVFAAAKGSNPLKGSIRNLLVNSGSPKRCGGFKLYATCDNAMKIFADGNLMATNDDWKETTAVDIPSGTNSVEVHCTDLGVVGGILAFADNGIKTDGSWSCSADGGSTWNSAYEIGPNGMSPWGVRPQIPVDAKWIWTGKDTYHGKHANVVCKITLG